MVLYLLLAFLIQNSIYRMVLMLDSLASAFELRIEISSANLIYLFYIFNTVLTSQTWPSHVPERLRIFVDSSRTAQ